MSSRRRLPPTRRRWTRRRRRWCSPSSRRRATSTWRKPALTPYRTHSNIPRSFHQQQAALASAQATLKLAQRQVEALRAQRKSAVASLGQAEAQRDQAKLNLSYTKILAPVDGMIAQRSVQVGNYVSVGGALMAVVPLSEVYVEANYREVQLGHVQAGQRARIHVDAYNIDLDGKVVDVPAASGTTFATLQPDNATGNFTKIVQRLPIKIVLAPNQPTARLLRVGLSVEATIQIP